MHGVTFLAFGNGANDLFSAIAGVANAKIGDVGLVFGALFGAGVFVTTVVVGSICLVKPFTSVKRPLLRDIVFFMLAGFWAFVIMWDGEIALWELLAFLSLYVVYIGVVGIGRYVNQKQKMSKMGADYVAKNDFKSKANNSSDNVNDLVASGVDENDPSRPLLSDITTVAPQLASEVSEDNAPLTYYKSLLSMLTVFRYSEGHRENVLTKTLLLLKVGGFLIFFCLFYLLVY